MYIDLFLMEIKMLKNVALKLKCLFTLLLCCKKFRVSCIRSGEVELGQSKILTKIKEKLIVLRSHTTTNKDVEGKIISKNYAYILLNIAATKRLLMKN